MKKVLFIGMTSNLGGLETFMINIFSKLQNQGFDFYFVNVEKNKKIAYSKYILNNGGHILNVPFKSGTLGYFSRHKIVKNFFLKHHNFDIVHLNTLTLTWLFWLKIANKYHISKLIVHSHTDSNDVYRSLIKSFFANILIKYYQIYLKKNNIIELAASKSCGNWMFNNNKYHIIPNGIDTSKFIFNERKRKSLKNKLGVNNNKIIIVVASFSYPKNYSKILHVFYNIHYYYQNTKLIIVGNGPEKSNIIKLIRKLHLNNDIILTGLIHNVNDMLNISDLMLMPSRYEGFPFSLIESQANGVPALVSNAIPKSSNITGMLNYLSLNLSDETWAKHAINMLKSTPTVAQRLTMNKIISKSRYNVINTIKDIKNIYL